MVKRTDEDIKISVVAGLAFDSHVDSAAVQVTVEKGQVTLSGTVGSRYERMAAVGQARNTGGVVAVVDHLQIGEAEASASDSDARLEARIHRILEEFSDLQDTQIYPLVENGIVTLNGSVSEIWRANRAELIVLGLRGVRDVVNNLAVIPNRKVSDSNLTDEISSALARHAYLAEENIHVNVEGGKVKLSGTVKSPMEADVVHSIAASARGVSSISSELKTSEE